MVKGQGSMGLLTEREQKKAALLHGKLFQAVCDECDRGIPVGTMYVVLKYEKIRWDGTGPKPFNWNLRVPKKVRCLDCNLVKIEPYIQKKKVVIGGKGRKKLTEGDVKAVNKIVQKVAIRMLKKAEKPIESKDFKSRLYLKAKKKEPSIKKAMVNATLRVLKKAKVIRMKAKAWSLVEVKK